MKRMLVILVVILLAMVPAIPQDKVGLDADKAELAEISYTKAIETRTADIMKVLALSDANKIAQVHDTVIDTT